MKKIELSADEIRVIRQYLNREFDTWTATKEQEGLLLGVVPKADALMEELDACDEMVDDYKADLIYWYWCKYKDQEGIKE